MPKPTPGELCYETYVASRRQQPAMVPWRFLQAAVQEAWEAAAQAVLARPTTPCPRGTPPGDA